MTDQFLWKTRACQHVPPAARLVRVVIDPGHGGRDPGALARFGGGHEADVNLAAGLILRDILNATGRYEVIMTRDRDVFVELRTGCESRARPTPTCSSPCMQTARAKHSPRGATVYSMNHRAVDRARSRAIREGDWVDAQPARGSLPDPRGDVADQQGKPV
jgi:N-acetylmuramoyl-L-alanine amidase